MKKFKSIKEGEWSEFIQFTLSDEQKEILSSRKASDFSKQIELKSLITSESIGDVDSETLDGLISLYNNIKPKDKNYKLISCDVCQNEEGKFSGILNYRINNEHKQLRFQ